MKVIAGIYKITCIPTGKFYIGSSNDVQRRWLEHRNQLRRGSHTNKYLQNAWTKHGEDNFMLLVVQVVENEDNLLHQEQLWLDLTRCFERRIGFNISSHADPIGFLPLRNAKSYIVTTPIGEEVNIHNLGRYCRNYNLNAGAMSQVAQGKANQHLGYRCRYTHQSSGDWHQTLTRSPKSGAGWKGAWVVSTPLSGDIIVLSLTAFCQEHNLSQGNMTEVARGKRRQHKEFRCQPLLPPASTELNQEDWFY